MLFWEALQSQMDKGLRGPSENNTSTPTVQRLPFDTRCAAITKAGHRCRGRARSGSDFCPFHDPSVSTEQRRANAAKAARSRQRLSRLPDGYLRKLTSAPAVAEAMDRLYREVRLGVLTPEMGKVMLGILTRLADTYVQDHGRNGQRTPSGKKISRLRPKLAGLLTQQERAAWREAVAGASHKPGTVHSLPVVPCNIDDTHPDPDEREREPETEAAPLALARTS